MLDIVVSPSDPYVKVTLRRGKKTKSKQTKIRHKVKKRGSMSYFLLSLSDKESRME